WHSGTRGGGLACELVADSLQRGLVGNGEFLPLLRAAKGALCSRFVALSLHRAFESRAIHIQALSRRGVLDKVVRYAERVVQLEGDIPREDVGWRVEHFRD